MQIVLFEETEASPADGGEREKRGTLLRLDEVCSAEGPSLQMDLIRSRAGRLFAFWAFGDLLVPAPVASS